MSESFGLGLGGEICEKHARRFSQVERPAPLWQVAYQPCHLPLPLPAVKVLGVDVVTRKGPYGLRPDLGRSRLVLQVEGEAAPRFLGLSDRGESSDLYIEGFQPLRWRVEESGQGWSVKKV